MPHFIRQVLLMGILCAMAGGCAAPRTFVETKEPDTKPQKATATASSKAPPRAAAAVPKSAPNHPEPSVWSKWMGALVPSKPKPTKRIPLPRTDKASTLDGEKVAPSAPADFSGF